MRKNESIHGIPMKNEEVFDEDRQEYGVVTRRLLAQSGSVMVRFGEGPEILYTLRSALGVWKAFPGPASAVGLRPLE